MFHERDNEYKMLVTNFQKMSGFINSINIDLIILYN